MGYETIWKNKELCPLYEVAEVFRKHIDDLLGEDLAQHIDYLACKELGGNLRNKYAHEGYGDDSQFSFDEIILFCLLIKAYCMGYDDEIGSK